MLTATLDQITNGMDSDSTLIGAIILVGLLAYIGTNTISPANVRLRRLVAYLSGAALIVLGALGFYFGASRELLLLYAKVYQFDTFRLEWAGVGAAAIIAGFLLMRQAYTRM
jgi:hypothetical protein